MTWWYPIRRARRRLRRVLGLPVLSRRAALLILLAFLGLAFLSVTVLSEFVVTLSGYRFQQYEPKDFQREELMERAAKPPRGPS